MFHSKPKRAFTLVELLIVIAIIGMLAGILLPAIGAARERARRLSCANNLKSLGEAIQKYELAKKSYPGWANDLAGQQVGWPVMILKDLDRADLYDEWRAGKPTNVKVDLFICPSSDLTGTAPLSYVANCGQKDDAAASPPDWPANGVFFLRPSSPPFASTDIEDGLQYTLLLSENLQAGEWSASGTTTTPLVDPETLFGMIWWMGGASATEASVKANLQVNADRDGSGTSYAHARPSSNHPGGVNVVYCDGHSDFLNEQVDFRVYMKIMATDDSHVLYAGKTAAQENPADLRNLLGGKLSEDDFK